jgi:hypothetical protein
MGFWQPHMQELDRAVKFLERTSYDMHEGRPYPNTGLNCLDVDNSDPHWADLTEKQREEVLTRYFDWTGFKPPEIDRIASNIAGGAERAQWFEGIEMESDTAAWHVDWLRFQALSPEERLRELASEVKRDGVQVHAKWDEMTPEQQREVVVFRLPDSDDLGIEGHQREDIIEIELGYRHPGMPPRLPPDNFIPLGPDETKSDYERAIDAAAQRGGNSSPDKGGPER